MADVSKDMCEKGLKRCREFLGGVWNKASLEDFHMERVRGGLSNLLYMCYLSDNLQPVNGEPVKVLLRIYGQIISENPESVLNDSVIFALLAEKNMGPKLYGVFTEGRIEEYVPSRHLRTEELHQSDISIACAKIMAQFHKLHMPMVKEPSWLFDCTTRFLSETLNNVSFSDADKQEKLQQILSFNLPSEFQHLKDLLSQVPSPVVFCHNDLQEGNILLLQSCDPDDKADISRTSFALRAIDYEWAQYNYRGFDIGNHFCEWCYNYQIDEPPYFTAKLEDYPNKEEQLRFIRAYLSEERSNADVTKLHKATDEEEEEAMLLEINIYALASHFIWGLWGIVQSHISDIEFGFLEYAMARFDAYFKQKQDMLLALNYSNGSSTSLVDGR